MAGTVARTRFARRRANSPSRTAASRAAAIRAKYHHRQPDDELVRLPAMITGTLGPGPARVSVATPVMLTDGPQFVALTTS